MLSKNDTTTKTNYLFDLMRSHGSLIAFALDYNLNENLNNATQNLLKSKESDNLNETKQVIKSLEKSSESKILALDALSNILGCFFKGKLFSLNFRYRYKILNCISS